MNAAITRTDTNGAYILFTHEQYAIEEFHTYQDLTDNGWDGTDQSLVPFLRDRIAFRLADYETWLTLQEAPDPPTVGFEVIG